MKLIIDIPENLYKATVNGLDANEIWNLRLAVKNGTPLDEIRAEIEETYINITYQENKERKATWGLRKALQIIDKYKAERNNEK